MVECLAFAPSIEQVFFQWIFIVEGKQGGISSIHGRSMSSKNVFDALLLERFSDDQCAARLLDFAACSYL